ncbi:pyrroline-5-carboxylate reductase, partial [Pseudomonadota bacterium]|nr:pyrroline-5-carboxylate reductase [Pseudomonadota bacterium]
MAQALIAGLLGYGISSSKINVIDPSHSIKKKLKNLFKVNVTKDLDPRILSNKIIVLAVKPNKISEVCEKIQASELNNTIIISVAAGATLEGLSQSLPNAKVIVRAMPNTPCLVKKGATVLISNQKRLNNNIKERVKNVFWVTNEGQIDIATAISGSGPAYFYYFSESLILAAIKLGMPKQLANELVDQTFVGAAL